MPSTANSPTRSRFVTHDPELGHDIIERTYGSHLRSSRDGVGVGVGVGVGADGDGAALTLAFDVLDAGCFTTADVHLSPDLSYEVDGRDEVVIVTVLGGRCGQEQGKDVLRHRAGDVYIGNHPGAHFLADTHQVHLQTTTLPASLLTEVADSGIADGLVEAYTSGSNGGSHDDWNGGSPDGSGDAPQGWRVLSRRPLAGGAERWRQMTAFVDDLLATPEVAADARLRDFAARMLAATALTVFPTTAMAQPTAAERADARLDVVDRVLAFIDAHPDLAVSLADLARAAGVSARTLQLAFRRHLDTTPSAYLRQARLARARTQLQHATAGDGTTVAAVAVRWGFTPARFAATYRAVYGELPGTTLRT